MHYWTAKRDKATRIRIWFDTFAGPGLIRLSQTGTTRDLATSNAGLIDYELPAGSNLADFSISAVAGTDGVELFVELSQDGATLEADDGVDVVNETEGVLGPLPLGAVNVDTPAFERFFLTRE